MAQKNFILLFILIFLPFHISCKRRSRIKKAERLEIRKKVVITDDMKLSQILAKQVKYMKFDEAAQAMDYYLKKKDLDAAIKCGQRVLAVGGSQDAKRRIDDQEILCRVRFSLAEIFLEKQNFKEAEKYAKEYQKFYPSTPQTIKAEYIEIQSNFLSQQQSDRDQKKTMLTIELAQRFIEKHEEENDYTPLVKDLLVKSYQNLIHSEINIIETHLNTYNYIKSQAHLDAALGRLTYIKEKYLPHAPATEKKIREIETLVAKAGDKPVPEQPTDQNTIVVAQKTQPKSFWQSLKSTFVEDNEAYFA